MSLDLNDFARGEEVDGVGSDAFFFTCRVPGKAGGGIVIAFDGALVGALMLGTAGKLTGAELTELMEEDEGDAGACAKGREVCDGLTDGIAEDSCGVGTDCQFVSSNRMLPSPEDDLLTFGIHAPLSPSKFPPYRKVTGNQRDIDKIVYYDCRMEACMLVGGYWVQHVPQLIA